MDMAPPAAKEDDSPPTAAAPEKSKPQQAQQSTQELPQPQTQKQPPTPAAAAAAATVPRPIAPAPAKTANKVPQRVLVRDTDHLAHFAADLDYSLNSERFADVILHCVPAIPAVGGGADKNAVKYPTMRVHRPVLAAISDYFRVLLAPHPIEEDVHVTLDGTPVQVAKVICEFAYRGEVKIAKGIVKDVCDAAERLQIKFLKDSFVKISDKDYAAYKAGKKPLPQKVVEKQMTSPLSSPLAAAAPAAAAISAPTAASAEGKRIVNDCQIMMV